jgi:hypothetical protein
MNLKNIHQRLAEVMGKVTYIQKEKKSGMRYSIVSHDAVTAKVRPPLLEAGILYYPIRCETQQMGNRTEARMTIRFVNIDDPADHIDVETFGYGLDDQDKGPGKAMSYAVKYALLKTLGLETGDDPDLDQDTSYRDPSLEDLALFSSGISTAASVEELATLLEQYRASIDKASTIDAAKVAMVRQAYAKRKKELTA